MSATPQVVGYAQTPATKERCPISGLKRSTFLTKLEQWKKHPVFPVHTIYMKDEGKSKGITLYNKSDLLNLLDYEAGKQSTSNQ